MNALGWSADSDRLLSAGQDGSLRLWDMHQGEPIVQWNGGVGGILSVDFDSTGRIACGGRDRKLALWDKPEGESRSMLMPDQITKLGLIHDSSHVVAGDAAGNIAVFSVENGNLAGNLSLPLVPPAVATRPEPNDGPPERLLLPAAELAAAEERARNLAAELAEVRESSVLADAAVKTAEDSLKKLRESAAKLKSIVAGRDAAAKEAARNAELLRARAKSGTVSTTRP